MEGTVTVLRMQNDEGKGPYYGASEWQWTDRNHSDELHPTPWVDRTLDGDTLCITPSERCAFASLAQLTAWFNADELRRLRLLGFAITEIEVAAVDVRYGRQQVVFTP